MDKVLSHQAGRGFTPPRAQECCRVFSSIYSVHQTGRVSRTVMDRERITA